MKSIHIFCASPASTAICSNTDSREILPQDLRRKDHHLNRFNNSHKPPKYEAPCSSRLPLDPIMPFYTRKSTSSSSSSAKKTDKILRRKSSADATDLSSSSRYLLSEKPFLDYIPEFGRAMVSRRDDNLCNIKYKRLSSDGSSGFRSFSSRSTESPVFRPSSTSSNANLDYLKLNSGLNVLESPPVPSNHQVVELMVSIHCKGCEGKLRKHITKMEGVTSFIIDLPTKKVTVIGDVTPLGVLTSISKVKNARLWPSPYAQSPRLTLTSSVFR